VCLLDHSGDGNGGIVARFVRQVERLVAGFVRQVERCAVMHDRGEVMSEVLTDPG